VLLICLFLFFVSCFLRSLNFCSSRLVGDGLITRRAGRHDAGFGESRVTIHRLDTILLDMSGPRGRLSNQSTSWEQWYVIRGVHLTFDMITY
jgi:hypothetical protein